MLRQFSSKLAAPMRMQFNTRFTLASMQQRSFGSAYLNKDEVQDRVINTMKDFDKVDQEKLSPVATFAELGLDSLDGVEAVMALEEEFSIDISDEQAEKIQSVKDAVDYISVHPNAN